MRIQDDSLYVEDECEIDELPSFNLPKNLAISGTGKKGRNFSRMTEDRKFAYHERAKIAYTSYSASPARPTKTFTNKFSFVLLGTSLVTPQKSSIHRSESYEFWPSFKKKKPTIIKPVEIQESGSDIWMETETASESMSQCWTPRDRETPNFNQTGMLPFYWLFWTDLFFC